MRRTSLISILIVGSVIAAASPVAAHVSVQNTSLTITGPGQRTVNVGDTVTISGSLKGPTRCRADQEIKLLEAGTEVDSTVTDDDGDYTFTFLVTGPTALQTQFEGSSSGVHPHLHLCAASTSRVIRIRTRTGSAATASDGVLRTLEGVIADVGDSIVSRI